MRQVPTVICVDVEPDARQPDLNAGTKWTGFEESLRLFEELRCRSGIEPIFCWFLRMDPQIEIVHGSAHWVVERYRTQIENLRSAGDEIGLHTHAWRHVGGKWITDNGDQRWVNQCVRVSFEAYESAFGSGCRSFRFGDHWMNNETFDLVENLGAQYNLTVEPGLRSSAPAGLSPLEVCTGRFPDYATVPREPYKPTREDFTKCAGARDEREMWVIPVSTALIPHWPVAPFYRRVIWRTRYGRRLYYPLSLAHDPDQFRHSLGDVVEGENARHLCVVLRTDSTISHLSARVRENLELLLSQAADGRLQLMTPARLVAATTGLTS